MPTHKALKGRRNLCMLLKISSNLCHFLSCLRYMILLGRKQVCTNTSLRAQSCHGAEQQSLQGAGGPPADARSSTTVFFTSELSPVLGITL